MASASMPASALAVPLVVMSESQGVTSGCTLTEVIGGMMPFGAMGMNPMGMAGMPRMMPGMPMGMPGMMSVM